MLNRVEKAVEKKKNGYNCAQAVACTYCDYTDGNEEDIYNATQAFGIGMATLEGNCGALSGAGVVIGLTNKDRNKTMQDTKTMIHEFKEKNSTVICKELKGIESGIVIRACEDCIRDTCVSLEKILEQHI